MLNVIKQTHDLLVLRAFPTDCFTFYSTCRYNLRFWRVFLVMGLSTIGLASYGAGVWRLDCQRIEPKHVSCEYSRSRLFDLIQPPGESYFHVTEATFKTERVKNDDEYVAISSVILQTDRGEAPLVVLYDGKSRSHTFSGLRDWVSESKILVKNINVFLNSSRNGFSWKQDNRVSELIMILLLSGCLFALKTLVVDTNNSLIETITFDSAVQELTCDLKSKKRTKRVWTLSFHQIQDVKTSVYLDEDKRKFYKLILQCEDSRKVFIHEGMPDKESVEFAKNAIDEILGSRNHVSVKQ